MSVLSQDTARALVDRVAHGAPVYYVAVGNTDGPRDPEWGEGPSGPIVFDVANVHAARMEHRYGACRIARPVFEDTDGSPQ